MKRKKKTILIVAKVVLAAALLTWVLSKTHWRNYVTTRDGRTYAVIQSVGFHGQGAYEVSTGMLWWQGETTIPCADLVPADESDGAPQYVYRGFASSIADVDRLLLALAMVGSLICISTTALRWWMLLRIQDIDVGLWETTRLTFLGHFFNFIVPGTVGGDLVKAYYVSKHTPRTAVVLVSIFVDRLLGFTELSLLATAMIVVALAGGLQSFDQLRQPMLAVAVVLGVLALMLGFLFSGRVRRMLHVQKIYGRLPIAHHIAAAGDAVQLYKQRVGTLLQAIGITVGAHVIFVGTIVLVGASLSLDVPTWKYFIFIPLIYIAAAVPVTPGGVGVVEGLYQAAFVSETCSSSQVLALALIARMIPMFWGLPGAIVAVTGAKIPKVGELEHELGIDDEADQDAKSLFL